VLGALTLVSTSTDRSYDFSDLSLAEDLAQRAALALDNVRLYHAAQRARETAERASQAKDQFLAMLSHELRTPLTPVLNAVGLLELDAACSPDAQDLLCTIRRNIELEARLIDDLLDLTRVSKGKVQLNLETTDAHELLRNTIEICQSDISKKRLKVELKLEAPRHHLHCDPARLQQVFWNLIGNAVKFTPEGGRLTIGTGAQAGDRLHVEVSDTGSGIEPELLPRVFDAFEQGRRGHSGGLGLGLAITKALVNLHHGEISAHSEGQNRGATFCVVFPTVDPPQPVNGTTSGEAPATQRVSLRVLLVEDHEDTNRTLSRLLSRRGYQVQTAHSVQSALAAAAGQPFDVLISDMGLPDGTGIELMEQLAEKGTVCGIALSGYGMEEDIQRSKSVGFREHLTKPVDIHRLDAAIQRVGHCMH
jgi:signal transduction histidine kinase